MSFGALTVSEIAAAGLPAIFVPFQHKDRQQYWNALPLENAGAAKIFEQPQFTVEAVADTLAGWSREAFVNHGGACPRGIHSGCYRTRRQ
ncbi:UDP-N-acetylglucosamine:N-acetylmuramyl-(pentapeptide) pyrophosphoryl-undecaprenol N-acetylglucosamine transferase [Salmonella enterica subsp. enterica]|uniref:UDP-N-acetylglucosamine:N-acetylmuramyl-(Pentapeptide) pyrophosphoryl-undecaprenol N-acetylglucosamine transferase n=1 Tax=Salmonella enterica I TaxID=59201 RepID=A0A447MY71_SALET|nr:UDP-N-acetylglucosamine:N-acetylmuramyl-(pentapeptide) pyrophosphoryl-undecaprenol N-acetylglucosamine transferase [Salmonella enterica subsp. enterica]